MPELDDLAGSVPVVVAAFLCFLWVDFIAPLESAALESPLIELLLSIFMESLLVCVCDPAVEAGVGAGFEAAS